MFIICTFCSSCYTRYKSSMRYFCANISNFKLLKLLPTPIWLAPLLTLALSMLCWLIMSQLKGSPWDNMALSHTVEMQEYCEFTDLEAYIRQPANSWSNFFFLLFGIWVFQCGWKHRKCSDQFFPLDITLAITFAYLCFGSFLFHASLTLVGQHWDMAATYGLVGTLGVCVGLKALETQRGPNILVRWVALTLALLLDFFFYLFKWELNSFIALPIEGLLVGGLCVTLYRMDRSRYSAGILLASQCSIFLAVALRQLDIAKIGCDPKSWFQGHAIWHLLTGLSGFLTWRFATFRPPQ